MPQPVLVVVTQPLIDVCHKKDTSSSLLRESDCAGPSPCRTTAGRPFQAQGRVFPTPPVRGMFRSGVARRAVWMRTCRRIVRTDGSSVR